MSEVLFGKDVFSVLHYSKAHYESMPLPQLRKDSVFQNSFCLVMPLARESS
jgi:hypothetical protein